jgi:hypothetical protein
MAKIKKRISPEGIVQSDIQVQLIEAIVKNAYLDLATYADKLDSGTLASKNRAIRNIADKYNLELEAWANITIPGLYYEGMDNSVKGAIKAGQVYEFSESFVVKHQEALDALISQSYTYTNKIAQGIRDSGTRVLSYSEQEKIKVSIGKGILSGDDLDTISRGVQDVLNQATKTAVVSVSGKRNSLDSYASTLARSILTDAQWQGTSNTVIQEGYDLVQVSDHFGECSLCRPYENEVLSLTGRTKGYTTLSEAKSNGLQHSNCRHSISPFTEGLAEVSKVWDTKTQSYQPKELVNAQNIVKEKGIKATTESVTRKASKYISKGEKEAIALMKKGTKPEDLFEAGLTQGDIIKANQRMTGLSLLADYDSAELNKDYTLSNQIAGVIAETKDPKIAPFKKTFLERFDSDLAKRSMDKIPVPEVKNILKSYEQFTTKIGIKDYNLVNQALKDKDIKVIQEIRNRTKDEKLKESLGVLSDYIQN